MAQNYTRQSSFADGDTITAALFNNEFNQVVNAFAYSASSDSSTGHKHDGTSGQGGNIPQIGDIDFLNKIVVDNTNNRWGFYVQVSGGTVEQLRIQDGAIVPVTNNDIDLGTSSLEFKDLFLDGTAHIDTLDVDVNATVAGTLGVTGASTLTGNVTATNDLSVGGNLTVTGNATIAGNLTFGDAATDTVAFSADVASNLLPSVDNTYDLGAAGSEWKDLYIDGTANIDSLVADTADINGGTIDGATIATSDITVGSGKTLDVSAGTLTLADNQISGDKVEGGTIAATTITALTFGSLNDGVVTVTAFADEDDMVSNSATLVPTQQSVKAYVDAQVTAQDLDIVGDTGTDSIDLDSETITFTGGTGITSVVTTGTVTHNIDSTVATLTGSQTLTNKSLTAPTLTGTAIVASLDISGDIDVDGTTNLDVVDIDGAVDFASTTAHAGNATFADNAKAIFGAGSDLQIYHDGTHSYLLESNATGNLYLGGDNLFLTNANATKVYVKGIDGGATELRHDNSPKLATTATGIDVTGTVTADGLTVDSTNNSGNTGTPTIVIKDLDTAVSAGQYTGAIEFETSDTGNPGINSYIRSVMTGSGGAGSFTFGTGFAGSLADRVLIDDNGDISFYEDTGTTPKLFWDSSAESLGIGTTSPEKPLHVNSGTGNIGVRVESSDATASIEFMDSGTTSTSTSARVGGISDDFFVQTNGVERLRIDASGNVGIGETDPSGYWAQANQLVIEDGNCGLTLKSAASGNGRLVFTNTKSTTAGLNDGGMISYSHADDVMIVQTAGDEAMRIDSSGLVSIKNVAAPTLRLENTDTSLTTNQTIGDIDFYQNDPSGDGVGVVSKIKSINDSSFQGEASLAFYTGNTSSLTERLRIDASGNVGIGTTSVPYPFVISDGGNIGFEFSPDDQNTGVNRIYSYDRGTSAYKDFKLSASQIIFGYGSSGGNEAMRIDSSGNVGIGVVPHTGWRSEATALQISPLGAIWNTSNYEDFNIGNNVYTDGTEKYIQNDAACKIRLTDAGLMDFRVAGAGSAGDAISWTVAMSLDASGNLLVGTDTVSGKINLQGNGTSTAYTLVCTDSAGNGTLQVRDDGLINTGTRAASPYNLTTASAANVHVLSNGTIYRSTSSERYKNSIQDATHGLTELLTLRSVTYKGNDDGDLVFGGLIAEEVHDAGLTEFVQYNEEDQPDALAYGNMVSLCIKAIQEQQATIEALTARIAALES